MSIEGAHDASTDCNKVCAPTERTCLGGEPPRSLSFLYTGESCAAHSNDASNFRCSERGMGVKGHEQVFLRIVGDQSDGALFAGNVNLGEQLVALGDYDDRVEVYISTVKNNGEASQELQTMSFNTRCVEEDDLTLLKTFGALQLVGYNNVVSGSQHAFASILIEYVVQNEGDSRVSIDSASSTGDFAGDQTFDTPANSLGRHDEPLLLGSEEALINLAEAVGQTYDFSVTVMGSPVVADFSGDCQVGSADFQFTVEEN